MSTVDELVSRLSKLSPMPDDSALTQEILAEYTSIVAELSLLKDPQAIRALVKSFGYGSGFGVYWETVHLLETYGVASIFPVLMEGIRNGDRGTKMWTAYMLGRIRDREGVDALISLLSDTNELVRTNAIEALGMIGDKRALPHLEKLLAERAESVGIISQAIRQITD